MIELFGVLGVIWLLVALGMMGLATPEDGPKMVGLPLVVAGVCWFGFVVCAVAGLVGAVIAS